MTCAETESRITNSDKEWIMWIVLWEYHFVLKLYFTNWFLHLLRESFEVFLESIANFIILQIKLHSPYVHVVLKEIYHAFVLELTRCQQTSVVLLNSLCSKCRTLSCKFASHFHEVFFKLFLLESSVLNNGFLLDLLKILLFLAFAVFKLLISFVYPWLAFGLTHHRELLQILIIVCIKLYLSSVESHHYWLLDNQEVSDNNIVFIRHYYDVMLWIFGIATLSNNLYNAYYEACFQRLVTILPNFALATIISRSVSIWCLKMWRCVNSLTICSTCSHKLSITQVSQAISENTVPVF